MRLLHTSDWHLGRRLHGADLLPAQEQFLEHLVTVTAQEEADVVLVAGDVYDRALPPPAAVELLSRTLRDLIATGAQVILSAGNHDSPARLGFAADVLELAGVHVRTGIDRLQDPVHVNGVDVYPVPYLEPSVVAAELGARRATHAEVMRAAIDRIISTMTDRPAILMAHEFVAGSTSSDSERDVTVGGLGVVPAEVFAPFAYTALGHLHRPQSVTDQVRYCGSPVAMSFSEADQVKGSLLVDIGDAGDLDVQMVPAPTWRPLRRLRGDLNSLLSSASIADAEDAWCEVTLTDRVRPAHAMDQVRQRFPHCLALRWDAPEGVSDVRTYADRVRGRDDAELCGDFVEHVLGRPATDSEQDLLSEAIAGTATMRRINDREQAPPRIGSDSASGVA
ncbi:exonuclease SbcCD subunit D [Demetria terragena]|uniref:exonuclease SbcCD subunit D n=1 Tax=Demetria terragena TaxID=63959 RepID=UPI000381468B|nr:exonuclease SbcCD subunit D [Demetria terragena]